MLGEVNNNDESTDEEVDESEDIPESDTENDPIVFESGDEESESESETDSNDLGLEDDYLESGDENTSDEQNDTEEDSEEDSEEEDVNTTIDSKSKGDKLKLKTKKSDISENKTSNVSVLPKSNKKNESSTSTADKPDKSTLSKIRQKDRVQNKSKSKDSTITKNSLKQSKTISSKKDMQSTKSKSADVPVVEGVPVAKQQLDEYQYDSSDEEDIRNTIGNVPVKWYNDYDHIGYDWDGKKIIKPQKGDQLDNFLKRMEDPDFWRTIKDPQTGQDVILSEADIELITRIQKQKVPDATFNEYAVSSYFIESEKNFLILLMF